VSFLYVPSRSTHARQSETYRPRVVSPIITALYKLHNSGVSAKITRHPAITTLEYRCGNRWDSAGIGWLGGLGVLVSVVVVRGS
jgi:hypothetical protein